MSISGRKKKFKKIKTYEEVGTTFKLKTEETNYLGTNVTAGITKLRWKSHFSESLETLSAV
jgi:hypothetical protein